jgi:hypothetical protein
MVTLFIDISNQERSGIIIFSIVTIMVVFVTLGMLFYMILHKNHTEDNNTIYEKTNYKKNRFDSDWQPPIIDDYVADAGGDTSAPE